MSGHMERLETFAGAWQSAMDDDLTSDVIAVIDGKPLRESDLRAALDELKGLRADRGEGEVQQRIVTPGGLIYPPTERDLAHRRDWLPGVRLEQRMVYGTPWEAAPQQPEPDRSQS